MNRNSHLMTGTGAHTAAAMEAALSWMQAVVKL